MIVKILLKINKYKPSFNKIKIKWTSVEATYQGFNKSNVACRALMVLLLI